MDYMASNDGCWIGNNLLVYWTLSVFSCLCRIFIQIKARNTIVKTAGVTPYIHSQNLINTR